MLQPGHTTYQQYRYEWIESFYDPMAYTFFHPFGTPGWCFKVNTAITPMQYYIFDDNKLFFLTGEVVNHFLGRISILLRFGFFPILVFCLKRS